jgi:hypothetical protein
MTYLFFVLVFIQTPVIQSAEFSKNFIDSLFGIVSSNRVALQN